METLKAIGARGSRWLKTWRHHLVGEAQRPDQAQIPDSPTIAGNRVKPVVGTVMRSQVPASELRAKIASRSFWYHQIELAPGIIAPGMNDCRTTLQYLQLPSDLTGMRVLDIGAAEGFFTFECEGRGAPEVLAIDYSTPEHTGFAMCAELLGSKARHMLDTIYNLRPERYGQFDLVLFLGILYHLPDPLLALHIVRDLCRPSALVFIETHVSDSVLLKSDGTALPLSEETQRLLLQAPVMQFYTANSLNKDDPTNFWGPNIACVRAMLMDVGFEVLSYNLSMPHRAVFNCRATAPSRRGPLIRQAYGNLLSVHPG